MVGHVHPVLSHAQVGLFVQVTGEGYRIFLYECHHWYLMADRVEITHVSDRSIPLVKGTLVVDDRLGGIETQDRHNR